MELQIARYQEFLRNKIYQSELDLYKKIGEHSFEEFYAYYEEEFKKVIIYAKTQVELFLVQYLQFGKSRSIEKLARRPGECFS